ncbi:hypothetical protein FQN49_007796, partial [Arthroderma sp. PD_2]
MFSEYASRFLSQSQSRIAGDSSPPRDGRDRSRRPDRQNSSRPPPSRPYLQRALGNPYSSSASQTFGFSPRASVHHAPLFHSTTDGLQGEEDDEREAADLYALQRSRRHFGASQLAESSEADEGEDSKHSEHSEGRADEEYGRGTGIRSSWRGKASASGPAGRMGTGTLTEQAEEEEEDARSMSRSTSRSSPGKGRMVDIRLEDSVRTDAVTVDYDDPPPEFTGGEPPIRQFQRQSNLSGDDAFQTSAGFMPRETDKQTLLNNPRPPSSMASERPPSITYGEPEPPMHDMFWGHMFLLCLGGLLATSFIVYLHTTAPSKIPLLGDTIYSTLHSSFGLLGTYTLVSVFVALLWLALLRSYVRPLVYAMLIAVP